MYANINNIAYIESEGMYHIITEYSRLAVESFNTEDEAKLFMRGYLMNTDHTEAECKGKLFRNMIDIDMGSGQKFNKLRELDLVMAV